MFHRLVDLVNVGVISILTTDVTIGQIVKNHVTDAYKSLEPLRTHEFRHFRNLVSDLLDVELPRKRNAEWRQFLRDTYQEGVANMFGQLNAKRITLDHVIPSKVFDDYINSSGFFDPKNKPNQFADAFVFAALVDDTAEGDRIIVVARDDDFDIPARAVPNVTILKSTEDLFAWFALEIEAPEIPGIATLLEDTLLVDELFANAVNFDDFDIDNKWLLNSEIKQVKVGDISAFKLFYDDLVIATVKTEVTLDISCTPVDPNNLGADDATEPDHVSGQASIEFFGVINVGEGNSPVELAELSLRKYELQPDPPIGPIVHIRFHY